MQRLVYTPKAWVFVKRRDGQIVDLSRYVTAGNVVRRVNAVSSASVTLRNPNHLFTTKGAREAAFFPQDPITIYLQRLRNRPVRAFTGFLDDTPYYQLYPGTIELQASCTLKKLQHTYFDPALPYTISFLEKYGWIPKSPTEIHAPAALPGGGERDQDGGVGRLLFATMREIGGWQNNNIKIEELPNTLIRRMTNLFRTYQENNQEARNEVNRMIRSFVGAASYGGSGGGGGNSSGSGEYDGVNRFSVEQLVWLAEDHGLQGERAAEAAAIAFAESSGDPKIYNGLCCWGLWQINATVHKRFTTDELQIPSNNAKEMMRISSNGTNWNPWSVYTGSDWAQGVKTYLKYMDEARAAVGRNPKREKIDVNTRSPLESRVEEQARRRDGRADKQTDPANPKIYAPIPGYSEISSPYGPRWGRIHRGIDVPCPVGTPCVAPADGKIGNFAQTNGFSDGGMIHFVFTDDVGEIRAGTVLGWGHVYTVNKQPGAIVRAGEVIGTSGHASPHVHFVVRHDSNDMDGTDPNVGNIFKALQKGETTPTAGGASGNPVDDTETSVDSIMSRVNATIMAANLNWPTIQDTMESIALNGNKSLMNDKPLLPFIQQLSEASLRQFMSMPNGDFFAFYPDYFGETFHRPPYWLIRDLEILDGNVRLNDSALVTHQYVLGDTNYFGTNTLENKMISSGSVSIVNAFLSDLTTTEADKNKEKDGRDKQTFVAFNKLLKTKEAIAFLERYGVRPNVEEFPMIRHPFFELFMAYQRFMQGWSRQFLTPFTFTFMPELYPGGKVGFPDHGLQMYIEEVTHYWDYASGFTTEADMSAPAVMLDKNGNPVNDNLPTHMPTALINVSAEER